MNAKIPRRGDTQVALAYPDLYEIGFAYYGFQILYHILNSMEDVSCQRVYAPAEDAEKILRAEQIPLFTVEGKNPLFCLDIIGFTLQYELNAPDILNMLELGGITLHASQRADEEPLILGGGPLAYNPEPFAPFFDAFLVGDGEEQFPSLVEKIRQCKVKGLSRKEIILQLRELEGVYIPSLYRPRFRSTGEFSHLEKIEDDAPDCVQAAHVESLQPENYPRKPLVPLISVSHDRLTVEIMRGCTRGCRFCNAGMQHRPTREAPANALLQQIETALNSTGYEELSLLSLSTADYSQLWELLDGLNNILDRPGVSLSYPSLRPDAFSGEMVELSSEGRKTSLTFAPEAGSQRMRKFINKDFKDEDLFRALRTAADAGWKSAKLYFMAGLPGETDEDIQSIIKLAGKCRQIIGSTRKKPLHISLAVFAPKPNTPFQRAGMLASQDIQRRIEMVKEGLKHNTFKISFHDPDMSKVETVISRGDRRIGAVIEWVYRRVGRLQGWSDRFDFSLWTQAMENEGLDINYFAGQIEQDKPLPWEHIRTGIDPDFLQSEWDKAQNLITTPDCRWKCADCGLKCPPPAKPTREGKIRRRKPNLDYYSPQMRMRFKFTRDGKSKYISHLETGKLLERSLRRADIPLAYSQGFHPHPRISFGPALPLGHAAQGEYFDTWLIENIDQPLPRIQSSLHAGMEVIDCKEIPLKSESLNRFINLLAYDITLDDVKPELIKLIGDFQAGKIIISDNRKGGKIRIDHHLQRLELKDQILKIDFLILEGRHPRPETILTNAGYEPWEAVYLRKGCFRLDHDGIINPLLV